MWRDRCRERCGDVASSLTVATDKSNGRAREAGYARGGSLIVGFAPGAPTSPRPTRGAPANLSPTPGGLAN
jgi:hypothetical protein